MKRLLWIATLILVLSWLTVATVYAQGSTPTDDAVNAIAKQMYCPVCENTPLDVCPTTACKEWREEIRSMLADGKSEAEIKQHFVDYYGARVLAEPPRTGLNWLLYVLPPIAIVAGAFVLFRALRTWSQASTSSLQGTTGAGVGENEAASPSDDEYIARMEEELKKRN
ncbi:MAG: cytochrome c-type biogenesis protein CcmH [Anaerolineales bacterium]|nr:cytochrome c-type biogenesis protein CcmH [Anaerolineales bacterium]